jgi:hypothetical protein
MLFSGIGFWYGAMSSLLPHEAFCQGQILLYGRLFVTIHSHAIFAHIGT